MMSSLINGFIKRLEAMDIEYDLFDMEGFEIPAVKIPAPYKNTLLNFVYLFDNSGESLNVKVYGLSKSIPENKRVKMLDTINYINWNYRWIKLFLDTDSEIVVSGDALITEETAAEDCMKLLYRFGSLIDKIYPQITDAVGE